MSSKSPKANLSRKRHQEPASEFEETPHLAKWMHRVLDELDAVHKHFKPRHVHDLRVALRRCQSVALGIEELDPCPAWSRLQKDARDVLTALGDLRDIQVLRDWIVRLHMSKSDAGIRLNEALDEREGGAGHQARKVLENMDAKQWHKWATQLPKRAAQIRCGSPAAELLALERWREAWELQRAAVRARSKISLHRLRVGIKRFRYSVEIFLPGRHALWGKELKKLQDLLGEVHDLDLLWDALIRLRPAMKAAERAKWRAIIESERARRLAAYRAKMTGPKSRWQVWREALPDGDGLKAARFDWLSVWAGYLDPNPRHSKEVTRLAVQIYDGILGTPVPVIVPLEARKLLIATGILHDVGRAEGEHHHQKTSYKLIRERKPPPGWTSAQMEIVACVARYHRGGLPKPSQKSWAAIPASHQGAVMVLAGILRLAAALASDDGVAVSNLSIEESAGAIVIHVAGYKEEEPLASTLAGARHLLESALHRPIVIQPGDRTALGFMAAV